MAEMAEVFEDTGRHQCRQDAVRLRHV